MRSSMVAFCAFFLAVVAPSCVAAQCVNNIPPSNPSIVYQDHGNGTVTDTRTALMWKRCSEGQNWNGSSCVGEASAHPWSSALALAESVNYAGHGDWRLPNIKELRGLVEECRANPAINDTVFPNTPSSVFWSSSPRAGFANYAWSVGFGDSDGDGRRDRLSQVRVVRGGQ